MKAQLWILSEQIRRESESALAICDKCLIDNYAYTVYFYGRLNKIEKMIIPYVKRYGKIIKFAPNERFLIDDGLRPTNVQFQLEIDFIIEQMISIWELDVLRINYEMKTPGEVQLIMETTAWLDAMTKSVRIEQDMQ